jgi:hypothetical protein
LSLIACQRWADRRERYRPSGERIRPSEYAVEPVERAAAKVFVEAHHYSGSFVASVETIGLWRKVGCLRSQLVGVAAFSVPPSQAVIPKWLGLPNTDGAAVAAARDARRKLSGDLRVRELRAGAQGEIRRAEEAALHGVDLGRFVLLPDVAGDGESWFLARAFGLLAKLRPGCRGVMATSDPLVRIAASGREVCPGHVGVIYQALGGQHVGRTNPGLQRLDAEARTVSERVFSKIRGGEVGRDYALRILEAAAGPMVEGEDTDAYLARARRELRTVRHPGCLVYRWALGNHRLPEVPILPYPRTATDRVRL